MAVCPDAVLALKTILLWTNPQTGCRVAGESPRSRPAVLIHWNGPSLRGPVEVQRAFLSHRPDACHRTGDEGAVTPRRMPASRQGLPVHGTAGFPCAVFPRGCFGSIAAIALSVLVGFGAQGLWASTPASQPDTASTHRSSSHTPRTPAKLSITPSGVTLSASQTQRFAVTGADGKPVAVHWDVSGLGCSGSACGTIDEDGTYRAPHVVSGGLAVILEGVLVSDPKHSVLTRIQLSPAPAPVPVSVSAPAPVAAPVAIKLSTHAPLVAYQGGQLTIDAENCTLAAVLQLVAEKTGAVIDVPPGSGLDLIVEHAGPGPANDVLTQLLNGSRFNFIIVDSTQYPDEPVQVLLSVKRESSEPNTVPVAPAAVASAVEVTPSDPDAFVPVLQPQPVSAETPQKEQLPPDVIEQMMKDKARQIRENAQQQQQQTQQ
jgi:hypothetical protein